ncbi:MAG: hypothetical protein HND44_24520 [Chloroflexi bacterium]|nr:hypothetical protein [Ardenticatenaceae bacterium]NOG37700.1 hypothetical protein [Chloroflexota bacterium]
MTINKNTGNEMGDYARTIRECTLDSLHPTLAASLCAHVQKYELGDGETAVLICCDSLPYTFKGTI